MKIDYPQILKNNIINVLKDVLTIIDKEGLKEGHHLYVTFKTDHKNVIIPVWLKNSKVNKLGNKSSLIIGFSQALAILPGISRSGATITTGIMLGISPKIAAEFSFLLVIPAILGGTILKMNEISLIPPNQFGIYLGGMIAAFIAGLIAIFCVLNLISKGKFAYFGFYCLLVGTTGLIYFASR